MVKVCPKCGEKRLVKNGIKYGKQAYKCTFCPYRFVGKSRDDKKDRYVLRLRREYLEGKQTYKQLGEEQEVSSRTIQRLFDTFIEQQDMYYNKELKRGSVYLIMDCTHFGNIGVLVVKNHKDKDILYAKLFNHEM